MLEASIETALEPIVMTLLSKAYQIINSEYNIMHALPDDCFIATSEDKVKALALQEEQAFRLNGIFSFEEVNPAMSYPVLNTLPKGTVLARIKPIDKMHGRDLQD